MAEIFKTNKKSPNGESTSIKNRIDMEVFFEAFDRARKTPIPKVR